MGACLQPWAPSANQISLSRLPWTPLTRNTTQLCSSCLSYLCRNRTLSARTALWSLPTLEETCPRRREALAALPWPKGSQPHQRLLEHRTLSKLFPPLPLWSLFVWFQHEFAVHYQKYSLRALRFMGLRSRIQRGSRFRTAWPFSRPKK